MMKFYRILLFIFIILPLIASDVSMAATGKLRGRILDKSTGEALPGVNVLITHQILSDGSEVTLTQTLGAATDVDGYFIILNIPTGQYAVRASIIGYSAVTIKPVRIENDRTIEVDFQLDPATLEVGEVVVIAAREIIKKDVSSTQESITTERIEQMPFLRVDEFLGSIKGVEIQSNAQGHGLSIRGGDPRETSVNIDGMSVGDPRSENSYLGFNTTTLREITLNTGGFEAKYGGVRSGYLDAVTNDGQRDKYSFSIKTSYTPPQPRYFGTNPWSTDSWIYRVYADTTANGYAWRGVSPTDTTVPAEFRNFRGWAVNVVPAERALDSLQKLELWKMQHPMYGFGRRPDQLYEGTLSGPMPGSFIPLFGEFAKRTVFMAGFRYEDSQLPFPVGPRDNYRDWNGQLKLTTQLNQNMRLSVNGFYAKIESVNGGGFSTYGNTLLGEGGTSFSYLNSTESSVRQAARLIGGGSFSQIFNRSRLQFFDQRYIVGGTKLTHTISNTSYYTVDFQMGFNDQELQPFAMDTSNAAHYVNFFSQVANRNYRFNVPNFGSPNASTNYGYDYRNNFALYGGPQKVDSSYSYSYRLKGDYTAQLGRHHQFETGVHLSYQDLLVYSGTWYQSQLSFTPDTWQYYKATPLEIGLYAQDKLEFEGIILRAGIRLDYLNPMKKGYQVGFPADDDYKEFLNTLYNNLGGDPASYERWLEYRALLESPPGWPQTENKPQVHISPRLGVSFPVTQASKLYFNYGHYYQRAPISFLYSTYVVQGGVAVPTPGLEMARTVSYEFGYEQMFLEDFLVNIMAYYKDISNEPLSRTYINYYEDNRVSQYVPDRYRDVRGFEIKLERSGGRFLRFYAMYDYMLSSSGQSGLSQIFENRLLARDNELRSPYIFESDPLPRANINVTAFTPVEFGPEVFGIYPLEGWYANYFFEWRDGGRILMNPAERDPGRRIYTDIVNYYNADMRISKFFNTGYGSMELFLTIKNVHNLKWLNTSNMLQTQYDAYKNSLKTPDKGGDDKWGEYDKEHIDVGWWEAPVFLNPRRFILGVRINL
jgi:hypothetical protein